MERSFWQERWDAGRIGFHLDRVHPSLERHWVEAAKGPRAPGRVLVPLCGKALDLLWLRDRGCHVVGVEFVRKAIVDFGRDNELPLQSRARDGYELFFAEGLELWLADFFALTTAEIGQFDGVFDRAALVAMDPARREQYARHLSLLTVPGGGVLLINLRHDLPDGPPHSVEPEEVTALFRDDFGVELLARRDVLDDEPHFRSRGATRFVEETYWLERR